MLLLETGESKSVPICGRTSLSHGLERAFNSHMHVCYLPIMAIAFYYLRIRSGVNNSIN